MARRFFARLSTPALLLTLLLLAPLSAQATTLVMLPFDDLVASSDAVVHGTVTELRYEQRDGAPVTVATVSVTEDWLEHVEAPTVEIVTLGGIDGDLRTLVHGAESYQVGEEVVVFAAMRPDGALHSVAMSYTKYRVDERAGQPIATRAVSAPVVPLPGATYRLLPPMRELQTETSLATLRAAVRDIAEVQR